MKTADSELVAYLQRVVSLEVDELPFCELYTLTLTTGDVLRYTDHDGDVWVGTNCWKGTGLLIPERGSLTFNVGLEVGEMQLDFHVGEDDQGNLPVVLRGLTLQQMATAGWLDKAEVLVQRLFWQMPDIGKTPPWGPIYKFGGTVAKPSEVHRRLVSLDCQDHRQKLGRVIPQTLIQAGCPYTVLLDKRCGLTMADWAAPAVVGDGSTSLHLLAPALTHPAGWFDQGFVVFTSGNNSGLAAAIKAYDADGIDLWAPLLFPPQAGDGFIAYPGCDGTMETCSGKFSNEGNFGGFRFVPSPETAL